MCDAESGGKKNCITRHVAKEKEQNKKIDGRWVQIKKKKKKEEGIIRRMIGMAVRFHFCYDVATNPWSEMGGRRRRGSVTNVS